ncbi:MAG: SRPBCC family protein [Lacisediminihabitans sp.]
MDNRSFSDSILVNRTPDALYALVSDITRMGEWSPVCTGGWWEDDSRGVDAWFVGHNETPERTWETRSQVVADEPGREFAFIVGGDRTRWGYTFEVDGDGTRMTESWDFLPGGESFFAERYGDTAEAEIELRAEAARSGIPETLAAIKKAAEAA